MSTTSHAELREQMLVFVSHQHWKVVNGRLHFPTALTPEVNSDIHWTGGLGGPHGQSESSGDEENLLLLRDLSVANWATPAPFPPRDNRTIKRTGMSTRILH